MTDKQIIIDDLDTRCPYHCNEKIGQCNNSSQETPHTYCINNKDCIYKQYARKEQECEKAKQNAQDTYDLWQALIESFNILQGEKIKLEQECEELDKELHKNFEEKDKLHLIIDRLLEASGYDTNTASAEDFEDVYENMRYEKRQLDQLKAENEDLKIYIESNEQQVKEVETLVMDNDRLINELDQLKEKYKWYDHYKESALRNKELYNDLSIKYDQLKAENETLFKAIEEVNKINKRLESENDELKKELESTKGLATVGNRQLAEALLELQKYKDNEQQNKDENCHFDKIKELTKEM